MSKLDEARREAEARLAASRRQAEDRLADMRSAVESSGFVRLPRSASLWLVLLAGAGGFALGLRRKRLRRRAR